MGCGWPYTQTTVLCLRFEIGLLSPGRVPPRQAGNFFLLAQKKVTKKEGLNTIWPARFGYAVRRVAWRRHLPSHHRLWCCFGPKRTEYRIQHPAPHAVFGIGIRSASDRNTSAKSARWGTPVHGRPPDRVAQWHGQIGVQALFFGDFFLGQQKKVTRLPGRDPAW
jgi:hypothetical protein